MYQNLAILAAFVLVYSAVAGRLEKTPISGAIVAMGFGLACGPLGLGIFTPHVDEELLRTLAELTLALVLFTDAANANLSVLKISLQLPERLLLIGLPLTILLGFGIGILVFPGMGLFELAVLATMLAPTDAALGKAVVTNPAVPATPAAAGGQAAPRPDPWPPTRRQKRAAHRPRASAGLRSR